MTLSCGEWLLLYTVELRGIMDHTWRPLWKCLDIACISSSFTSPGRKHRQVARWNIIIFCLVEYIQLFDFRGTFYLKVILHVHYTVVNRLVGLRLEGTNGTFSVFFRSRFVWIYIVHLFLGLLVVSNSTDFVYTLAWAITSLLSLIISRSKHFTS